MRTFILTYDNPEAKDLRRKNAWADNEEKTINSHKEKLILEPQDLSYDDRKKLSTHENYYEEKNNFDGVKDFDEFESNEYWTYNGNTGIDFSGTITINK